MPEIQLRKKWFENFGVKIASNRKSTQKTHSPKPSWTGVFFKTLHCSTACVISFCNTPLWQEEFRMTSYQGTKACCICTTYIFVGVPWFSGVFSQKRDRPEVSFRCLCSIWDKRGHAEPLTLRANHFKNVTVHPAWCWRPRYEQTARTIWNKIARNHKGSKAGTQHPADQVLVSKLC